MTLPGLGTRDPAVEDYPDLWRGSNGEECGDRNIPVTVMGSEPTTFIPVAAIAAPGPESRVPSPVEVSLHAR